MPNDNRGECPNCNVHFLKIVHSSSYWPNFIVQLTSDTAHRKAVPATAAVLREDSRGMRGQVVSTRRRATSSGPPGAIRRAIVDLTVGVIVVPGTQEVKGEVSKLISLRGDVVGISGWEAISSK